MKLFASICLCLIPAVLTLHFCFLVIDDNSKYQKKQLRKALDRIFAYLASMTAEGSRYPTVKLLYKNREFNIGIYRKDHNYYYTTYEIFINGDEAGQLHKIGDCFDSQYYFEKQNHREQYEVFEIIRAAAKEVKKLTLATTEKKNSWNEYSYFK